MSLFSITKKNMKDNFKNYVLYFATMVFSICIYFTFVSVNYNDQVTKRMGEPGITIHSFKSSSVILIIFVSIFIWYSNSSFIKKRKKEMALYSLLGVTKRKIGAMLFFENFIMGIIALILGIGIGFLLSKLLAMLLLRLMELPTAIPFSISLEAIFHTTLVVAIIIFITSFHGYRIIYKFKLIELLQVDKQGKHIKKGSVIIAVLGICLLTFSYWLLKQPIPSSIWANHYGRNMLSILGSSIIGTYFVVRTCTVFVLVGLQKYKKFNYRGINMVGVSQLLSHMQTNAKIVTAIIFCSTFALYNISSSLIVYYTHKTTIDSTEPFSFMYVTTGIDIDQQIKNTLKQSNHTIENKIAIPLIKVKANLNVEADMFPTFEEDHKQLNVLAESTFRRLAIITKKDIKISLKDTEAIALDSRTNNTVNTEYKNGEVELQLPNDNYTLQFTRKIQDYLLNESLGKFIIVVSDNTFSTLAKQQEPYTIQAYKVSDDKNMKELTKKIQQIVPDKKNLTVKYTYYKTFIERAGFFTFGSLFLGLVFLAATGSIFYFKLLTEAGMSKNNYIILRELGVNKQMIFRSIAKQVAFIFIAPLCIGSLYNVILFKTISSTMFGTDIFIPICTTIGAYTFIYFLYYLLTVKSYIRIVNKYI